MPADAAPSFLFVPEIGALGDAVELSAEETHYLLRVCRARLGDSVRASDGRGVLAALEVTGVRGRATARVESRETIPRRRECRVLCGAPEGDRADWLVEKLAELGVAKWQPIDCEHRAWRRAAGRLERWRRLAVAALRQSRRTYLLELAEPVPLERALAELPAGSSRWLADPRGGAPAPPSGEVPTVWVGAIGPSEGLSLAESGAFRGAGFEPICLSEARLRTETAAMALACWWEAQGAHAGSSGLDAPQFRP